MAPVGRSQRDEITENILMRSSPTAAGSAVTRGGSSRLRVLVSAFACCPPSSARFSGGEDVLGWNLVQQVARFHDAVILTHALDRADIERELRRAGLGHLRFEYVGLPRWLHPLFHFPGGIQLYCYLWQIRAYGVARQLARRIRFDVVHQLTYANDWMASFVGALLPTPYLRGPCGGAHRVPQPFLKEYTWIGRLGEYVRAALQWVFRLDPVFIRSQHRASRLLVCNREALEALPPGWRRKAELFPVNGVSADDLRLLAARPLQRSDGAFRVLSAGKLIRLKGFALGMKAFKEFADQHPEAVLEIVGDGPDRRYLERIVEELGLDRQVQFVPWLTREQFLRLLIQCDVFLFPSLRDGGGAVVVEAMAAGKPVVCLELSGPGFHVTEECGVRLPAHRPQQVIEDMAAALERLHGNPRLRAAMGEAGRRRAQEVYRWDHLGDRLMSLYADVAGHGKAAIDGAEETVDAQANTPSLEATVRV